MVRAAVSGQLDGAPTTPDPVFGLAIPQQVPGVPTAVMNPRGTWKDGAAYDAQAAKLAGMFRENITKFGGQVSEAIRAAGPRA